MALFFYEGVVSIRGWPLYLDREWIKNHRGWPSYILYIEAPSSSVEMFKKKKIVKRNGGYSPDECQCGFGVQMAGLIIYMYLRRLGCFDGVGS